MADRARTGVSPADAIPIALALGWLLVSLSWLSRSLNIDEITTYWVIEGSLPEAFSRALHYQGQSPLYYLIVWLFVQVLGASEVALRLPSVIASSISILLCGLVARRLVSRELVVPAVVLFTLGSAFSTELGGSARPYALAVMFFLLSLHFTLAWTRGGKRWDGAFAVVSFVLCVYAHYLFAPAALVLGLALFRESSSAQRGLARLVQAGLASSLLLLPSLFQLLLLREKIPEYVFATTPSLARLLLDTFPLELVATLALVLLSSRVFQGSVSPAKLDRKNGLLLAVWVTLPPLAIFAASESGLLSVYVARYFQWRDPGIAIGLALLLSSLAHAKVRILAFHALCLVSVAASVVDYRGGQLEDWRGAIETMSARAESGAGAHCVAVYSGLVESNSLRWLTDEERRHYMATAIRYYSRREGAHVLPWNPLDPELAPYTAELSESLRRDCDRVHAVIRIIRYRVDGNEYDTSQLVRGYLGTLGFATAYEARAEGVHLLELERADADPAR